VLFLLALSRPSLGAVCTPTDLAEADARQLRVTALGTRMLEDVAALHFGEARSRVSDFGDWAYGWTQSYLTAYRIMGHGLWSIGSALRETGSLPEADTLGVALAAPVRAEFVRRVTQPTLSGEAFTSDMSYLVRTLGEEWPEAPSLTATLAPMLTMNPGLRLSETLDAGTIFLRSMRPMAARLGVLALRVTETGSIIAAGSYVGWGLAGTPGVVAGAAGGIGLSWGLDWAFNRIDASMNRGNFEAQALAAIAAAEVAMMEDGRSLIREAAAAAAAEWRSAGCP